MWFCIPDSPSFLVYAEKIKEPGNKATTPLAHHKKNPEGKGKRLLSDTSPAIAFQRLIDW